MDEDKRNEHEMPHINVILFRSTDTEKRQQSDEGKCIGMTAYITARHNSMR